MVSIICEPETKETLHIIEILFGFCSLITRSILNPLLFQILKKEGVTVEVIRELTEKGTNYHFIRHYLICIDSHLFKKCFINVIVSLQW